MEPVDAYEMTRNSARSVVYCKKNLSTSGKCTEGRKREGLLWMTDRKKADPVIIIFKMKHKME